MGSLALAVLLRGGIVGLDVDVLRAFVRAPDGGRHVLSAWHTAVVRRSRALTIVVWRNSGLGCSCTRSTPPWPSCGRPGSAPTSWVWTASGCGTTSTHSTATAT